MSASLEPVKPQGSVSTLRDIGLIASGAAFMIAFGYLISVAKPSLSPEQSSAARRAHSEAYFLQMDVEACLGWYPTHLSSVTLPSDPLKLDIETLPTEIQECVLLLAAQNTNPIDDYFDRTCTLPPIGPPGIEYLVIRRCEVL